MANQQLLNYIKQQQEQGVSQEHIMKSLMLNGWQAQDIEAGFTSLINSKGQSSITSGAKMAVWKIILIIVFSSAIVGAGIYLASQQFLQSGISSTDISDQVLTDKPTETSMPTEQLTEQNQPQSDEDGHTNNLVIFADNLHSCTPYQTTFQHPLTGEAMEREILGLVTDNCIYVEQMPNNGKMECSYTENERRAAAQFYKDSAAVESAETNASGNLMTGEYETTHTIDGQVVNNPLQEMLDNGSCIISGY